MDTPGTRFFVDPAALPPPEPSGSVNRPATTVPRPAGTLPQVPDGFQVSVFADGFGQARWLEVAPNGDVLLARPDRGDVLLLRDTDGDGSADLRTTLASGFQSPEGLAVRPDGLYVADVARVWRVPYQTGDTAARGAAAGVTPEGALGAATGHMLRPLAFSADGRSFFVGVGSESNLAVEPAPRATILQFDADGGNGHVYASGLRNPAGLEVDPATGQLYATVVERDALGDNLVPDFLTRVQAGGFYGWPYAYSGPNPQPELGAQRPDLVARTITPDVLFQAHSTPLDLAVYGGGQFPEAYTGDVFVALHGSWNASVPRGYMVARVSLRDGVPVNGYEAFMTGFQVNEGAPAQVYGRPSSVAVRPDGSLLVADNVGGTIYQVRYVAPSGDGGDNRLTGGSGADRIDAGAGNDVIDAGGGNDTLLGGTGDDWVTLGSRGGTVMVAGVETLVGGSGADWVSLDDQGNTLILAAIETLLGGAGQDAVTLGNRGNTLILAAVETLTGGSGHDLVLLGNRGNSMSVTGVDALVGGSGTDDVTVSAGGVQFDGRGGADVLTLSGAGSDLILFGSPDDGGAAGQGAGFDVVRNFQSGSDQVLALGGLRALVDGNGDGQLARVARNGGTVDLRADELVQLTTPAGALNDAGFAGLRSALGRVATDGAARSVLVTASDGYNGALYVVSDDGDGVIGASEVRMLARFDGVMPALGDVRLG